MLQIVAIQASIYTDLRLAALCRQNPSQICLRLTKLRVALVPVNQQAVSYLDSLSSVHIKMLMLDLPPEQLAPALELLKLHHDSLQAIAGPYVEVHSTNLMPQPH